MNRVQTFCSSHCSEQSNNWSCPWPLPWDTVYTNKSFDDYNKKKLECGPVPNVMAALPNIGGAFCSTPQSLADAHCWSTAGSNTGKTRKPLKCAGVHQTTGPISAASGPSSPYCRDMWRRYCCLTSFFTDCWYMPQLGRYSPTKLCDGTQMAIFGIIFASCIFSELRVAHFRHAF